MSPKSTRTFSWLITTILHTAAMLAIFGFAAYLLMDLGGLLLRYHGSESWPVASGKLLKARIEQENNGKRLSYDLKLDYSYQVEGKIYRGHKLGYHKSNWNRELEPLETIRRQLLAGKAVPVYYSPRDPATALLMPGLALTDYLLLLVPIGGMLIPCAGLFFYRWEGPRPDARKA